MKLSRRNFNLWLMLQLTLKSNGVLAKRLRKFCKNQRKKLKNRCRKLNLLKMTRKITKLKRIQKKKDRSHFSTRLSMFHQRKWNKLCPQLTIFSKAIPKRNHQRKNNILHLFPKVKSMKLWIKGKNLKWRREDVEASMWIKRRKKKRKGLLNLWKKYWVKLRTRHKAKKKLL